MVRAGWSRTSWSWNSRHVRRGAGARARRRLWEIDENRVRRVRRLHRLHRLRRHSAKPVYRAVAGIVVGVAVAQLPSVSRCACRLGPVGEPTTAFSFPGLLGGEEHVACCSNGVGMGLLAEDRGRLGAGFWSSLLFPRACFGGRTCFVDACQSSPNSHQPSRSKTIQGDGGQRGMTSLKGAPLINQSSRRAARGPSAHLAPRTSHAGPAAPAASRLERRSCNLQFSSSCCAMLLLGCIRQHGYLLTCTDVSPSHQHGHGDQHSHRYIPAAVTRIVDQGPNEAAT